MITAKRFLLCKGSLLNPRVDAYPGVLAPPLLLINKQIRQEGCASMYKINNFSIVLNQASYLGYPSPLPRLISVVGGDLASVPSKWIPDIRRSVYQMRRLTIYVTLNLECEEVEAPSRALLEDKKSEVAAIVSTALGELCENLSLSENLTSLRLDFLDLGREQLTTGNEDWVVSCLGQLKGLKHVEICGLRKRATDYLEHAMKRDKAVGSRAQS